MSSNFSLTTFANDGKLEQVNNALAAANNGETSIGLKTKDGIILACEKYLTSIRLIIMAIMFCSYLLIQHCLHQ